MTTDETESTPPRSIRIFTSTRTRLATIEVLFALGVGFVALSLVLDRYIPELANPLAVRELILSYGVFSPLAFIALQATQVVVAPVPGQVLGFAGGYLFGGLAGTAYSLTGAALGSWIAFSLARRYGRPYVERVVYGPTLEAFDEACRTRGLLALFVVFLVPGLPDDVLCLVAGLTDLDIRKMVVVSVFGRLPGYSVVAFAGTSFAEGDQRGTALLLGLLLVASLGGWYRRRAILAWLGANSHEN
jgi:uncharacterized membrane protein YdjX (TVP38/TMEM64 family)